MSCFSLLHSFLQNTNTKSTHRIELTLVLILSLLYYTPWNGGPTFPSKLSFPGKFIERLVLLLLLSLDTLEDCSCCGFELGVFCGVCTSPATLREVVTLAFLNRGGGVELFFSYNNKQTNTHFCININIFCRNSKCNCT